MHPHSYSLTIKSRNKAIISSESLSLPNFIDSTPLSVRLHMPVSNIKKSFKTISFFEYVGLEKESKPESKHENGVLKEDDLSFFGLDILNQSLFNFLGQDPVENGSSSNKQLIQQCSSIKNLKGNNKSVRLLKSNPNESNKSSLNPKLTELINPPKYYCMSTMPKELVKPKNNNLLLSDKSTTSFSKKSQVIGNNKPQDEFSDQIKFVHAAKDQSGCRMLQRQIEGSVEYTNCYLFPRIKSNIVEISINQFGNYLIQKLIEKLNPERLAEVACIFVNNFKFISVNQFGTRVMQRLIDFVENIQLQAHLILACRENLPFLSTNSQASHVVSKILSKFRPELFSPLLEVFEKNLEPIVKDKHGCCVIQKLIENVDEQSRKGIISLLLCNVSRYILDPFANYVLQQSITYNYKDLNALVLQYVKQSFVFYCLERFSSNVIEKALTYSNDDIRQGIIQIIVNSEEMTAELLISLYGNHVLQKALLFASESEKETILNYIFKYLGHLEQMPHGPKLKCRLATSFPYFNTLFNQVKQRQTTDLNINTNSNHRQIPYLNFKNIPAINKQPVLYSQLCNPIQNFYNQATPTTLYPSTISTMDYSAQTYNGILEPIYSLSQPIYGASYYALPSNRLYNSQTHRITPQYYSEVQMNPILDNSPMLVANQYFNLNPNQSSSQHK